jgi:hypothetical protein
MRNAYKKLMQAPTERPLLDKRFVTDASVVKNNNFSKLTISTELSPS